jgi:hypothetical protein
MGQRGRGEEANIQSIALPTDRPKSHPATAPRSADHGSLFSASLHRQSPGPWAAASGSPPEPRPMAKSARDGGAASRPTNPNDISIRKRETPSCVCVDISICSDGSAEKKVPTARSTHWHERTINLITGWKNSIAGLVSCNRLADMPAAGPNRGEGGQSIDSIMDQTIPRCKASGEPQTDGHFDFFSSSRPAHSFIRSKTSPTFDRILFGIPH